MSIPLPTDLTPPAKVKDDGGVQRRVFRQTTAYAALRSISGVLTWASFILLFRILGQRNFGAFEIGMFYVGVGSIIGDGGLAASLVRRRGAVARIEYSTALTTVLCIAGSMALALFLFAPFIGAKNHLTDSEIWLMRALAPLYFVPALRLVPYVRLERALDFASIGRIELYANIVRHSTAIGVALLKGGVWALALSQIAQAATQTVLAYRAAPGFVGFGHDRRTLRDLFDYGGKVQASALFLHLKENLSAGLLGPWLGPAAVGVFRFALEFVRVPAHAIGSLARVQFPVYARYDRESPELATVLRTTLRAALLVGLPLLGILVTGANFAIGFVYGSKWEAAAPLVWALAPHVACDLLALHLITFVQGQGRAGLALVVYAAWSATLWATSIAALALTSGSLVAVAFAHGVSSLVTVGGLLFWASRHLERAVVRDLSVPLFAGLLAFGAALACQSNADAHGLAGALLSTAAFLGTFGGILFAFERRTIAREWRAAVSALS